MDHAAIDADLFAQLKAGDPSAERKLRQSVMPYVRRICWSVLKDPRAAEEAAEDVWTDFVIDHAADVRSVAAVPGYLRLMAVRRSLRARDARNRVRAADGAPAEVPPHEANVVALEAERERDAQLAACLEKLPQRQRQLLRMRFHKEMTQEAMGAVFGTSKQYVGRLLAQALEALRTCMEAGR